MVICRKVSYLQMENYSALRFFSFSYFSLSRWNNFYRVMRTEKYDPKIFMLDEWKPQENILKYASNSGNLAIISISQEYYAVKKSNQRSSESKWRIQIGKTDREHWNNLNTETNLNNIKIGKHSNTADKSHHTKWLFSDDEMKNPSELVRWVRGRVIDDVSGFEVNKPR